MNRQVLDAFERRVAEIEAYWVYLGSAAEARETSNLAAGVNLAAGLRKVFDYSSVVVALYGAVEDYVERLAEHCVEVMNNAFIRYSDIPLSTRKQHEKLSLKLADQVEQAGYRGHLNTGLVIGRLHGCLSDDAAYRINQEAFSIHGANIRRALIREMFAALGISNIDQAVVAHQSVSETMPTLGRYADDVFYYIDDLADRRNIVAHGERPQDVISTSLMPEYLIATQVFGQALFDCALLGLLEMRPPKVLVDLGKSTADYSSGEVLCFEPSVPFLVESGTRVIWQVNGRWRSDVVQTVQVEGQEVATLAGSPGTRFGARFSHKVRSRSNYWLISSW